MLLVKQTILFKKKVSSEFKYLNIAKKDEDGKVITGPRNFTTKPVKKGKIDSVYIMKPSYLNPETNDP